MKKCRKETSKLEKLRNLGQDVPMGLKLKYQVLQIPKVPPWDGPCSWCFAALPHLIRLLYIYWLFSVRLFMFTYIVIFHHVLLMLTVEVLLMDWWTFLPSIWKDEMSTLKSTWKKEREAITLKIHFCPKCELSSGLARTIHIQ